METELDPYDAFKDYLHLSNIIEDSANSADEEPHSLLSGIWSDTKFEILGEESLILDEQFCQFENLSDHEEDTSWSLTVDCNMQTHDHLLGSTSLEPNCEFWKSSGLLNDSTSEDSALYTMGVEHCRFPDATDVAPSTIINKATQENNSTADWGSFGPNAAYGDCTQATVPTCGQRLGESLYQPASINAVDSYYKCSANSTCSYIPGELHQKGRASGSGCSHLPPSMRMSPTMRSKLFEEIASLNLAKQKELQQMAFYSSLNDGQSKLEMMQYMSADMVDLIRRHAEENLQNHRQMVQNQFCVFCRNNGEPTVIYNSHVLKKNGKVVCPLLKMHSCEICGACGEQAHTRSYCPHYHTAAVQGMVFANKPLSRCSSRQTPIFYTNEQAIPCVAKQPHADGFFRIRSLMERAESDESFQRTLNLLQLGRGAEDFGSSVRQHWFTSSRKNILTTTTSCGLMSSSTASPLLQNKLPCAPFSIGPSTNHP